MRSRMYEQSGVYHRSNTRRLPNIGLQLPPPHRSRILHRNDLSPTRRLPIRRKIQRRHLRATP